VGEDVQVWLAGIDPAILSTVFRQAPSYRAFYAALVREAPGSLTLRGGRFVAGLGGRVRFEQTFRAGGKTLTLVGERVSLDVVPPPPLPDRR
jgi:hypothetical protein